MRGCGAEWPRCSGSMWATSPVHITVNVAHMRKIGVRPLSCTILHTALKAAVQTNYRVPSAFSHSAGVPVRM
jgi:hypothetical protein